MFVPGLYPLWSNATGGFAAAVAAAERANVATVLVVGSTADKTNPAGGREAHDRYSIALPGAQDALIVAVAAASRVPITLVVIGGGSLDLSAAKANPKVGAILWCGYPGQSGGTGTYLPYFLLSFLPSLLTYLLLFYFTEAIAQTLWGVNNPSGRLTQTFYPRSFITKSNFMDYTMRPNATTGYPGRGYRFYTGDAVYRFGAGLSFSKLTHHLFVATKGKNSELVLAASEVGRDARRSASAPHRAPLITRITITSSFATSDDDVSMPPVQWQPHVVMLFVRCVVAESTKGVCDDAPLQRLVGFQRVILRRSSGGAAAHINVTAHHLVVVNNRGETNARPGSVWRFFVVNGQGEEESGSSVSITLRK